MNTGAVPKASWDCHYKSINSCAVSVCCTWICIFCCSCSSSSDPDSSSLPSSPSSSSSSESPVPKISSLIACRDCQLTGCQSQNRWAPKEFSGADPHETSLVLIKLAAQMALFVTMRHYKAVCMQLGPSADYWTNLASRWGVQTDLIFSLVLLVLRVDLEDVQSCLPI